MSPEILIPYRSRSDSLASISFNTDLAAEDASIVRQLVLDLTIESDSALSASFGAALAAAGAFRARNRCASSEVFVMPG